MSGVITRKDVLFHSILVIRLYGIKIWIKAISRRNCTFLSLLF